MTQQTTPEQRVAVVEALINEFQKLGIDVTTEDGRRDFRETMMWARSSKKRCEKSVGYTVMIVIGGMGSLVGAWVLTGAKKFFGAP